MLYAILGLVALASIGFGLYSSLNKAELVARVAVLEDEVRAQEADFSAEVERAEAELAKLRKYEHIPGIVEKSRRLEAEIAVRLDRAQKEADEIVLLGHRDAEKTKLRAVAKEEYAEKRSVEILQVATQESDALKRAAVAQEKEARLKAEDLIQAAAAEAERMKRRIIAETEGDLAKARQARGIAEGQAVLIIDAAQHEARKIASEARKEAKAKTQKADDALARAAAYALEIRERADVRAKEIGGKAYEALKKSEFYEAAAKAMENVASGYADTYLVPASHLLDELAEEYGFAAAGEKLKLARDRTRIMERDGNAATCNYPEGWKRDYAVKFVLGAFNGKVDSILSRLKPANQGKLIQEIKDVYALANHNGEVFRSARVHEEYLDARLQELKWGVAVQRLREKDREEQRAIREQLREEAKAQKEFERARKQAEREEDLLARALEQAHRDHAAASAEDRAKYERKVQDLAEQLKEAEEKNQRAISMAQQTKCGHVYVISNVGSFGEHVYKIGLTRRLEPLDRVRELGGASVPFGFDVHALIYSQDAPALEAALHRKFLQCQVNKANRRKEFFRLKLQDIRNVIDEMNQEVRWTMAAEASDYRETLAMERQMQEDPGFRAQWEASEAAYESRQPFDDEGDEASQENEILAVAE